MTRTLCSKKKQMKSRQEVLREDCNENSPSVSSQRTRRKLSKFRALESSKENRSPRETLPRPLKSSTLITEKELFSPIRKSIRRLREVGQNTFSEIESKNSVFYDKTNSLNIREKKPNEQNCCIFKIAKSKNNTVLKLDSVLKQNFNHSSMKPKYGNASKNENHVPVYKNKETCEDMSQSNNLTLDNKENIYEFHVNENDEPVQKKKRKKRVNTKKPKLGPKSLTINNIKYSSTESLISFPDKTNRQKKKSAKGVQTSEKPYSSVTNLSDGNNMSFSMKNFVCHPPSQIFCKDKNPKLKLGLSVLQETESEQCPSQIHRLSLDLHVDANLIQSLSCSSSPCNSLNTVTSKTDYPLTSYDIQYSPRCYTSKINRTPNHSIHLHHTSYENSVQNDFPEISSCSVSSTPIFLSSTPCKQIFQVDSSSIILSKSYKVPQGVRPSTGFIKDSSEITNYSEDNCFGFDEPEEIEEPLVSPIKDISLKLKPLKLTRKLESSNIGVSKPTPQEVIDILKSTIPEKKRVASESSSVFDTLSESSSSSSCSNIDQELLVNFKKPPRHSYGRQRRLKHYSQSDESELESGGLEEEIVKVHKTTRKYTKSSKAKTDKPARTAKVKQKTGKEEEEIERLVAQMNAQFEEIEKVNLVVE